MIKWFFAILLYNKQYTEKYELPKNAKIKWREKENLINLIIWFNCVFFGRNSFHLVYLMFLWQCSTDWFYHLFLTMVKVYCQICYYWSYGKNDCFLLIILFMKIMIIAIQKKLLWSKNGIHILIILVVCIFKLMQ